MVLDSSVLGSRIFYRREPHGALGTELGASGEAAFDSLAIFYAWDLFVFALPDARTGNHAIVAVDQAGLVTIAERGCLCRPGDDHFCVGVLLVLRETVYDEAPACSRSCVTHVGLSTDYTERIGVICFLLYGGVSRFASLTTHRTCLHSHFCTSSSTTTRTKRTAVSFAYANTDTFAATDRQDRQLSRRGSSAGIDGPNVRSR